MCSLSEGFSFGADAGSKGPDGKETQEGDEESHRGGIEIAQSDSWSFAVGSLQGSIATEKASNVKYNPLQDLNASRKAGNKATKELDALLTRVSSSLLGPEVTSSQQPASSKESDSEEQKKGTRSRSVKASQEDKRPDAVLGAETSGDTVTANNDDKPSPKPKVGRFRFFFGRGGNEKKEAQNSDASLTQEESTVTQEESTVEGTQDESSLEDSIHHDFYDKMIVLRQTHPKPLYLYRNSSTGTEDSAEAHMKVYELGELVKDVPLAVSSVKRSLKYMGRQLSGFAEGGLGEDVFEALRPPEPDKCTMRTDYELDSWTCSEASVSFRDTSSSEEDTVESMEESLEVADADLLGSAVEVALANLKENARLAGSDGGDTSFDAGDGPKVENALTSTNGKDEKMNTASTEAEEACESPGGTVRKRSILGWTRPTRILVPKAEKKSPDGGETKRLLEQECMSSDAAILQGEVLSLQEFLELDTADNCFEDTQDRKTLRDVTRFPGELQPVNHG